MNLPHLPGLPTLSYPPSWLNNAGNLDRSACFEIRLKEVRQLAGCVHVRQAARLRGTHRVRDTRSKVQPLPNETPAVNGLGRETTGIYELTKHALERMASFRIPRAQAGDHRSARANAMLHRRQLREVAEHFGEDGDSNSSSGDGRVRDARGQPRWKTNVRGIPRDQRDDPLPEDRLHTNAWANLLGNGKVLGVPPNWSQPVRLEKWIYPRRDQGSEFGDHDLKPALPKYYLICPGVLPDNRAADARHAYKTRGQHAPKKIDIKAGHAMTLVRPRGSTNDPRLAPLSDAPLGETEVPPFLGPVVMRERVDVSLAEP